MEVGQTGGCHEWPDRGQILSSACLQREACCCWAVCRDRPKKGMSFLVERGGQTIDIPVTVAEAPDGTGRIGVQLAVNAKISKIKPDGPLAAVQLAAREFGKLTSTVVTGERLQLAELCPLLAG